MAKNVVFYEKSTVMLIRVWMLVTGNAVLFKWDLQLFMLSRPRNTFCFKRVVLTACTHQTETDRERHRETDRQTDRDTEWQRHDVNCSHDVGHPATCLTRRKVESQQKKQKREIWSMPRSQKVFIHHAAVAAECQCCLSYQFFNKGRSSISRRCHKYHFCHDKSFASTNACLFNTFCPATNKTHLLLWQKYACCDKTFVMTKLCLPWQLHVCHGKNLVVTNMCFDKHVFVMTKVLSQQAYFSSDKRRFFHDKHVFVATKVSLSWQKFCHDKMFVVTNIFHNNAFVATKICLSWQAECILLSWQETCFVMTKMILVATTANDTGAAGLDTECLSIVRGR